MYVKLNKRKQNNKYWTVFSFCGDIQNDFIIKSNSSSEQVENFDKNCLRFSQTMRSIPQIEVMDLDDCGSP